MIRRLISIAFIFAMIGMASASATVFYVAPQGNNAWSGTLAQADANGTDGPFASLQRARDAVRSLKASGLPEGGVTIWVRGGRYELLETFTLTAEDAGTAESPILYAAYPGEEVILSGGKQLKDWKEVTDPDILSQWDEAARRQVRCTDLKAQGISNFGEPDGGGLEVFFMGAAMTLARWPNEDFTRIEDIVVDDGHKIHGIPGSKTGKIKYSGDRPTRWLNEKDPWAHGYWFWDWSDERQRIESIDPDQSILSLKEPYHSYGYRKGQWYYGFNLLSELDTPGEWYLDRETGILYFWPTQFLWSGHVSVSMLPTLVDIDGAAYTAMRGFVFQETRAAGLRAANADHVEIARCIFRNLGAHAVSVSGKDSGVRGCEIYQTGSGGISLSGGDRTSLTPANLYAENNHIHHYGRIRRMYTPGIGLHGVGLRAANNLIHSAPHMGIQFSGNDHLIEFNELHHVCEESNDAGAMYAGRDWTMRGHVIRHNFLHDIEGFEHRGCVGVYLDDMFASAEISGNIFHKVTRAAFIGGGRDCSVENNIFVDCKPALHVDARALNWAAYHADEWIKEAAEKGTIKGVAFDQPPYSTRYPELLTLLADEPKAPKGNTIARNISWGGKWDGVAKEAAPYLDLSNNLVDVDPLFVDAAQGDYRLRPDSPAWAMGFQAIPAEEIGLYARGPQDPLAFDAQYQRAVDALSLPAGERTLLRAREDRAMQAWDKAKADYARVLEADPQNWDAALELGHVDMRQGAYLDAYDAYGALRDTTAAPADYRALAGLQAGEALAREGSAAAARTAWESVAALPDVAPHLAWEARDRIRESEAKERGEAYPAIQDSLPPRQKPVVKFFVAPDGSDDGTGAKEAPFATFEAARKAIRDLKAAGPLPQGGVAVTFRQGTYTLSNSLNLTEADSGTPEAPIVYRAFPEETVLFTGGVRIQGFRPVQDTAILARLPEDARDHVLVCDLKAQGITDFGTLEARGVGFQPSPMLELFIDGQPMTLARWPNEGFLHTGTVDDPGSLTEGRGATFAFDYDRAGRWQEAADIWLYGYWYHDWADCTLPVDRVDMEARRIHTAKTSNYTMRENQEYYVFNLLEEIDQPGEYYLDRASGMLYCYPPADLSQAVAEVSLLQTPLATLEGVSNVRFEGLQFELAQGYGITVHGGSDTLLAACTVRKLGGTAVLIQGGARHGVFGCELERLGRRGIELIGGDRATLTSSGHYVENCDIHHFSRIDHTYTPAVQIEGVGHRIAHNHMHHSSCHAMRLEGNDHVVEFNEINDVVRESDDQGGLDMWGDPTYRGNILRYNHWHDIGNGRACGQGGIRLDDAICGTVIYGNVFERSADANFGGVQIHGGKENWIDNNLFIDCPFAVSFSSWGKDRWLKFLSEGWIQSKIQAVHADQPPYSTRYPALAHLEADPDVNNVWRNVAVNARSLWLRHSVDQNEIGNVMPAGDPGFLDADSGDYQLRDNAPITVDPGFRPIPFHLIGQYAHPLSVTEIE